MRKDFILTFLTQIIVLISGLLVFKLAMVQFGDIGFSEFSIVKRNIAYLFAFIQLALGLSAPRYIALEKGKKSGNENNVFLASLLVMFFSLATTGFVLLLFQEKISFLLFGNQDYTKFIFPIYISIVGFSLHTLIYSYFRGKMIFNISNLLQIINIGLVPLAVFLFAENIQEIFLYTGFVISSISLLTLIKVFISNNFNFHQVKKFIPKLIIYGAPRLPADLGLASLLALPAIFSAHIDGVIIAGYVAFSISLLSLSGQTVAPVGLIMLPKISHLLGEKNFTMISYYVKKMFIFSLMISIAGTVIYQIFAREILSLYLGKVQLDLVIISKEIMWGILFYPFYITMRNIVDAYYKKAYNTISILFSLLLYLFLYFITQNNYISLVISLATMALLTFYFIKPLFLKGKK